MKVFLVKPFGYENYAALKPDDFKAFLNESEDGDEYIIKVVEMTNEEYDKLEEFKGY